VCVCECVCARVCVCLCVYTRARDVNVLCMHMNMHVSCVDMNIHVLCVWTAHSHVLGCECIMNIHLLIPHTINVYNIHVLCVDNAFHAHVLDMHIQVWI